MKDKLKNAYKPTPEGFRYAVTSAIHEAEQSEQSATVKKHLSHPARIVLAAVLILAIIPTAVFGATKLIGLLAKPVDKYGVELSMETTDKDYPVYVKMNVDVPDGIIVEPNTDGLKYSEVNSGGSFSLCPMRPKDGADTEVVKNVDRYEEITLCGHAAYRIKQIRNGSYDRIYVSYDDMNVLLLIYYTGVSEEQLASFVGGISFSEGKANDHTELWELFDERTEDKVAYEFGYTNIEFPRETVMTFSAYSEQNNDESLRYTAQISDVQITDSLDGLDVNLFNSMYFDDGVTDSTGKLLPRTVTVTKAGDGFNTVDEVISSEEKEQKLVLVDVTYTNLSDEDTVVYIPYELEIFDKKDNGSYDYAWNIDPESKITSSGLCDNEIFYVSDPVDTVKSLYCTTLNAGETKTVTIGYRCVTDALDKAYLMIYDATSASIVDPAPEGYDSRDNIPNYNIKVL